MDKLEWEIKDILNNLQIGYTIKRGEEAKTYGDKKAISDIISLFYRRIDKKRIRGIISEYGQLTTKYPDKQHLLAGRDTFISCSQYNDLAEAIAKELKGERDETF